jgi:signal transduction histidine kinase
MPQTFIKAIKGFLFLFVAMLLLAAAATSTGAPAITNLLQMTQVLDLEPRVYGSVRIEGTVCAASRPEAGVLILRDKSGVELLEVGNFGREIRPGEMVLIEGSNCLLRRQNMGIELTAAPVVNNDGTHSATPQAGWVTLKAGRTPLRLGWFNCLGFFDLQVSCARSNEPIQNIASTNLYHTIVDQSGHTNFVPGLSAECYEGYWETVPDFDLFHPVKSGVVTNFDLNFRTRDELVGMQFTGFFNVPSDGQYLFQTISDDGSLLFVGPPNLSIVTTGFTNIPEASPGFDNQPMQDLTERRWVDIEGRCSFIVENGRGLEFDLRSDDDVVSVGVADATGLDPTRLSNSRVRIRGVGRESLTTDKRVVLGKVFAASAKDIDFVAPSATTPSQPITAIAGVQSLPVEEARRGRPVRICGVVTDAKHRASARWMSIQDDTRGIFVSLASVSNKPSPGELWQVEGLTGAGDFAPVIVAEKMTFLGNGRVPEPVHPTWSELANGSLDVQWAELLGLVTAVQSNTVTLLLPEGQLDVSVADFLESDLMRFEKSVVRIRGVLYAVWDATRQVRVGSVMMRNASISVDKPAPANPFDAVLKTPRELRLFDAQATAFRHVKLRGQIVYADATQIFLEEEGMGLRLLPANKTDVHPGDLVEAVGYPDFRKTALLLREVVLHKTGTASLGPAKELPQSDLARQGLDSTRVRVAGRLLGWHFERGTPVLEMQSGSHLYFARLLPEQWRDLSLRPGSRLALSGVYVQHEHSQALDNDAGTFDLLLNSPADIVVLSQPSWWTLPRLLALIAALLLILALSATWIRQLRRLVEQRTVQLQHEIRERERIERQHALEAERSRIARDLHDDLGSSLTEISVLASSGQHSEPDQTNQRSVFQVIASKARSLVAALDVIVWAVDPEDNSLQSLGDFLSGYTEDFFSHTNITCDFDVPVVFPEITLEGRVRHDLVLAVKETLNNVVRHAGATAAAFKMTVSDHQLEIKVVDNGKGFEGGDKDGHGLKNLSARLLNLGGSCTVDSRLGIGTTVVIQMPLPSTQETRTAPAKTD